MATDPSQPVDLAHRSMLGLVAFVVLVGAVSVGVSATFALSGVVAALAAWLGLFAAVLGLRWWGARRGAPVRGARLVVGVAAILGAGVVGLTFAQGGRPWPPWTYPPALGLVAVGCLVLVGYFELDRRDRAPWAPAVAAWGRAVAWVAVVASASTAARWLDRPWGEGATVRALCVALALVGLELVLRDLGTRGQRTTPRERDWPEHVALLRVPFSHLNPVVSVFQVLDGWFGIDLRSTWALTFLRRSLEPLAVGLAVAGWLSTGLVMVHPWETGVRVRLGRPIPGEVAPGLHLALPWPLESVVRVPTARVLAMPIGHELPEDGAEEEEEEEGPEDVLWARSHGEEYTLLLGDGRDLVTLDGVLQYRIVDAHRWLFTCQNPEEAVRGVAYRAVMRHTVSKTLDQVLSENLSAAADAMVASMREDLEAMDLGVQVVSLALKGLHPPFAVAEDYQRVVSAQIEERTRVIRAEAYRARTLLAAEAEALEALSTARSEAVERVAAATGEALGFMAVQAQWRAQPALFKHRRRMEALERELAGQNLVVIDHRIEAQGGALWLLE